ncbi:hypothetical protein CKM354_000405000 [Cercospora kikuchii]|uniref:RNA recognition motif-containing protein n=1 Tax=Cercospora kikuchii TaxID=84275 RepID=A0A9P3CCJ5_9PEZI|nr:uncharacterized protein CKM354_000405000 [Cercospora kikuchii]GIZ40722.1 hypothetical protein CKM354_000405000 [Cercospora kikuchii]
MPAGPGDQHLTTLFADVHYYLSDPSSKPSHDRFAKSSYVYLYYNTNTHHTKLEIANHAGTPDQDAFHGYLQTATVKYNHLQPALISFSIDTQAVQDHQTWHLPAYDLKNEQKYLYKIHALDVYLWTEKDAATFIGHLKSVLSPDRLDVKNAPVAQSPPAEHRDSMSPVVQQLERTAIGSNFPPRTTSAVSAQSLPGPPTPLSSAASPQAAPAAYNPAAPAAPEPVTYREKTPPPPDGSTGTGLQAAAKYDNVPPQLQHASTPGHYQSSAQTTPQAAYFSGPPQQQQPSFPGPPSGAPTPEARTHSGSMPPPPTQSPPAATRAPSFGPMAASTIGPASPPPNQTAFRQSSFGAPQQATYNPQTQYANYPASPGIGQQPPTPSAPPAYAGHTPLQSPGVSSHQQVPVGGYSNYSYASSQQPGSGQVNQHGAYVGDLHSQAYRPTEVEQATSFAEGNKIKRSQTSQDGTTPAKNSKLQDGVGKMEGKVGKFFSKLDKLY